MKDSSLARLQQSLVLALLATGLGWFAWHWPEAPWLAATGFVVIVFSYAIFLAIEFALLRRVSASSYAKGIPKPTIAQLTRAWIGETVMALRVFGWRQPFRSRAIPDRMDRRPDAPNVRGVVLVHGFVCNRGFWNPWLDRLETAGHPFIAVNLEPVFGSIQDYVPIIENAVEQMTRATGTAPVLVCHSMGGLAARAWLASTGGVQRAHRVVTIGSPHHGTWLGRFSHTANGREMRLDGGWVRALDTRLGTAINSRFTCWYSNCDNIVFPVETATLAGADNRLVPGMAHVDLAFHPEVVNATLALISAAD